MPGVMCRRPEFKLDTDFSSIVLQKNSILTAAEDTWQLASLF
jgi:hypothetical protein